MGAPDGAVSIGGHLGAVAVELAHYAALGARLERLSVFSFDCVSSAVVTTGQDFPVGQIKDVSQTASQSNFCP